MLRPLKSLPGLPFPRPAHELADRLLAGPRENLPPMLIERWTVLALPRRLIQNHRPLRRPARRIGYAAAPRRRP